MYLSISSGTALRAVPTRLVVVAALTPVVTGAAVDPPAMRNGVPFEQWLTLRVVFRLESR